MLPPLSKFYHGPAQGWASSEGSSSHYGFNTPQGVPPSSVPRIASGPPAYSPTLRQEEFDKFYEESQGWYDEPTASGSLASDYSTSYALAPGRSCSPVNPGWDSRPTSSSMDTSSWGVSYKRKHAQSPDTEPRPPLPPRPSHPGGQVVRQQDQAWDQHSPHSKYSSQHLSARVSATTIDVPLFLQAHQFDAGLAPPLPKGASPPQEHSSPIHPPPLPQRLPPPPPKIPLGPEDELQKLQLTPQRHIYDLQNPIKDRHHKKISHSSLDSTGFPKKSRFGPQDSNDDRDSRRSCRNSDQRPSTHDEDGNSRRASHEQETPSDAQFSYDENARRRYQNAQQFHQDSVSPINDSVDERDRWASSTSGRDSQVGYGLTAESQDAVVVPRGGQSTSATDASSNRPGASTPDSQLTSNTSYRGSEAQAEPSGQNRRSNGSFYRRSGRSSPQGQKQKTIDMTSATPAAEREPAQTATEHEVRTPPARSTSLRHTPPISYGASVLGFGGPSDWEYFGDYEGAEIDDEELYNQKPRAELQADHVGPQNDMPPRKPEPPGSSSSGQDQPAIQERSIAQQLAEQGSQDRYAQQAEVGLEDDCKLESKWSPSTTTPTTPRTNISQPLVATEPMRSEEQRADLEEMVRAWSDAPYVGRSSERQTPPASTAKRGEYSNDVVEASAPGGHLLDFDTSLKHVPLMPAGSPPIDRSQKMEPAPGRHRIHEPGFKEEQAEMSSFSGQPPSYDPIFDSQSSHASKAKTDSPSAERGKGPIDRLSVTTSANTIGASSSSPARRPEQRPDSFARNSASSNPGKGKPELLLPKTFQQPSKSPTNSMVSPQSGEGMAASPSSDTEFSKGTFGFQSEKKSSPPVLQGTPSEEPMVQDRAAETTTGGLTVVAVAAPVAVDLHPNSAQGPVQVISGDVSCSDINPAHSPGDIRGSVEVGADERLSSSIRDGPQDVSIHFAKGTANQATPAGPRRPSPTPPRLPSNENVQAAAVAVAKADATVQEVLEDSLSRKASMSGLRCAGGAPNGQNIPGDSARETASESLKHAHASRGDSQQTPAQSVQGPERRSTDGHNLRSLAPQERLAPKADNQHDGGEPRSQSRRLSMQTMPEGEVGGSIGKDDVSQDAGRTPIPEAKGSKKEQRPSVERCSDPYADLDPWGRASLNRFAAMLREEARVESNKDKLNIFNVFTTRESRLRVVLYGTDDELILPHTQNDKTVPAAKVAPSQKRQTGSLSKEPNPKSSSTNLQQAAKALPPLPSKRESTIDPPASRLAPLVIGDSLGQDITGPQQAPRDETPPSVAQSPSESQEYSPGGRPIAARPRTIGAPGLGINVQNNWEAVDTESRSIDTTMPSDFGIFPEEEAPQARSRLKESGSEVKDYLTNRRSVYRPFATQTMESMVNTTAFGREPDFKVEEPSIPVVSALRNQNPSATPTIHSTSTEAVESDMDRSEERCLDDPPDLLRFVDADFDPLAMILPESESVCDSAHLLDLKKTMDAIADDFSFIHESVVAWDSKVKAQRAENERQRHARQVESEQRIDSLFDDHEIGYGDIGELESEFKRSEAERKSLEDEAEYQAFVEDVFDLVWARLHYELGQLSPHYEEYARLLNDTLAGKEMFNGWGDGLALAPAMSAFLGLHQKLEIRHQKAFEAVLERDRRLKKTEISSWYSLGQIATVKQLEKQFEDAEREAIIEYCGQRTERANRLMDILDQNTLRGVGANQDYMEGIMKAVRGIASGRAFASLPGCEGPRRGIELVHKATKVAGALATSSEQIVQTFHVGDMLLNSADYEVSVAKAKGVKADVATLARLKEERAKEDQKLMRDLEHRLALMREDCRRMNDELLKLMLLLGMMQNGRAITAEPPSRGLEADDTAAAAATATGGAMEGEHEARMRRALDEAKKRNAARDGGQAGQIFDERR
ncbi:MAG: hypothetical protein Q9163_005658 [Psora crenata]